MSQYIYINGYPGVGKLTIARELSKLFPGSEVWDNHRIIDLVRIDRDHPDYNLMRAFHRRNTLLAIATSDSHQNTTYIFTDARCSSPFGSAAAQEYEDAARRRGLPFIPIALECQLEENIKRVTGSGRGGAANGKLTDVNILKDIRQEEQMFRFGGDLELELDVTELTPEQAAYKIFEHVKTVTQSLSVSKSVLADAYTII
ncbi:hypothetical protein K4K54_005693 [Colletotrichum sp. SAR 10_86]|nr:hypothetical protein K4K54_005693 [Colletotrichum sp. SAR 10_86]KAI8248459.1 hypothetical protein K4K53_000816 [Colletotrichum sp. SAR 10_77]